MTATNSNYSFDADVNRDGIINKQDVKLAKEDLGASTQVSPVVSVNLNPASDPAGTAPTPYSTVHFAGDGHPGATVTFVQHQPTVPRPRRRPIPPGPTASWCRSSPARIRSP